MSNLNSRLSRYAGTTKEQLEKNDPATRRNSNAISYLRNDVLVFKPKEDEACKVRVLPTETGLFYLPALVHFGMGPDFDSYPCRTMKNEECPLCKYSRRMYTEGDKEAGYHFKAAGQNIFRLLNRKADGDKAFTPLVLSISNTILTTVQNLMIDPDTQEVLSIDNMIAGRDLFFTKKKTGQVINGKEVVGITALNLSNKDSKLGTDAQIEKILDYLEKHPMESLLNWTEPEVMAERSGISDEEAGTGEPTAAEEDEQAAEEEAASESEEAESEVKPEPVAASSGGSMQERIAALKAKTSSKK